MFIHPVLGREQGGEGRVLLARMARAECAMRTEEGCPSSFSLDLARDGDDSSQLVALRKRGFFAGHSSVNELKEYLVGEHKKFLAGSTIESVEERATCDTAMEEAPSLESQSSTESNRRQDLNVDGGQVAAAGEGGADLLKVGSVLDSADEQEVTEIDEYSVMGKDNELASLMDLPLLYRKQEIGGSVSELHVLGKGDHREKIVKRVTAWRIVFSQNRNPVLKVRSDHSCWLKLLKPQSGYQTMAAKVFFVASFLNFARNDPHASESATWRHLQDINVRGIKERTIREYLSEHFLVIEKFAGLDPTLADADVIQTFHSALSKKEAIINKRKRVGPHADEGTSLKKEAAHDAITREKKKRKIQLSKANDSCMLQSSSSEMTNGDDMKAEESETNSEDLDEDNESLGDPECYICDDGGDLLCCDGPCMRSFHAHKENDNGQDSHCPTLGYSKAAVEKMGKWFCGNCQQKQHQCYICGQLGASDEALKDRREVFGCDVAFCGRFYHLKCLARKLAPVSEQTALAERIKQGVDTLCCPLHTCKKCGKAENKEIENMQLAKCRRCPVAWHKQCLPEGIRFNDSDGQPQRAWVLGERGRLIIYCENHEIDEELLTPKRDHLKFPPARRSSEEGKPTTGERQGDSVLNRSNSSKKVGPKIMPLRILRHADGAKKKRPVVSTCVASQAEADNLSHVKQNNLRVLEIVSKSMECVTLDVVKKQLHFPSCYEENPNKKLIHNGELSSILSAITKALEGLKKGGLQEAQKICPKTALEQLTKAETSLRVYLAPALNGNRYTSFGRHFTKVDKLREVVDRLHPYVDDGDMVVDMCCGSNDFSLLMHEALNRTGKEKCQFKNFDIHPPKHKFNFEHKDWFTVTSDDLLRGSQLVIGLNPPFGVDGSLANRFIRHALNFRPKLVVLIVPPETMSLKEWGYVLILEDPLLLKGPSFYLPGSVDETTNEELSQKNTIPPPLYIWCRRDYERKLARGLPQDARLPNTVPRQKPLFVFDVDKWVSENTFQLPLPPLAARPCHGENMTNVTQVLSVPPIWPVANGSYPPPPPQDLFPDDLSPLLPPVVDSDLPSPYGGTGGWLDF